MSSAHPCVYNRSEARCSRRGTKKGSRSSNDTSAIEETLSRSASNAGSPSKRSSTQQQQQHRVRKGSQSRRKSTSSSAAPSRSSTEPDAEFASPRSSAATSVTGSPYSLASFSTISESGNYSISSPYNNPMPLGPHQHQAQQQQHHIPYSMPYQECGYQSNAWPANFPRNAVSSGAMSNSFVSTVSNPHTFPVLTPPDDYMQFQAYSSLQTVGDDLWQYHR